MRFIDMHENPLGFMLLCAATVALMIASVWWECQEHATEKPQRLVTESRS